MRQSGARLFIDLRLILESNILLEHAESIADVVTSKIHEQFPTSDGVVDTAPHAPPPDNLVEQIRTIASGENFHIHDVTVIEVKGRPCVNLDLEVDPTLALTVAHEWSTRFEMLIKQELPRVHDTNL